ncbi:MAG TPA: hypothetical protein VEK34_00230 [Methylocella sp.]|nr:hypothetical protein [Methylocella sp.]
MERSTILKSRWLAALPTALLAVVSAVAVSVTPVQAQSTELKNVGISNVIGVRASFTAPFYIEGEPFGSGVWQPLSSPVSGSTFATVPSVPQFGFGGANCNTEYRRAQIVASDGSTLVYNLVDYRCLQPSGASTTNGLYDIVGGTGRFGGYTAGGGIFSIDENADGHAFLALSGMHCPRPKCVVSATE